MKYLIPVLLASISSGAFAGNVTVSLNAGAGSVDAEPEYNLDETGQSYDTISYGFFVGYKLDNGLFAEMGIGKYSADLLGDLVDSMTLKTREIGVGYSYQFNDFYIQPRIGYASWDLTLDEGVLFDPDPQESSEFDGSDLIYAISGGYQFTSWFGMSLGYQVLDASFGQLQTTLLSLDFQF